jgi:glycosyltransferase involved in cell wall biosynthesis
MGELQKVAIISWGNCLEHAFLNGIGVTEQEFRTSFRGSWVFGYIDALRTQGIESVSFYFSCHDDTPHRAIHEPTASPYWVLPAPRLFRAIRRTTHCPPLFAGQAWLDYLSTPMLRLARMIRAERCTALLVQGHDYPRFDLSVLLGRLLGLPVYSTYQGGADMRRGPVLSRIRHWTFGRIDGLIIPSEFEAARIQRHYGVPHERIARVLNPVKPETWAPSPKAAARSRFDLPEDHLIVAWHGRVAVMHKGLDLLLDAWKQVLPRIGRPAVLHLLGSGPDRNELVRLLDGMPAVRWIDRFVSDAAEIRDFLSAADVYVFPSRAEGFAVAPVEAISCGLSVIASRAAHGIDELFPRGVSDGGWLLETTTPETLTDALVRILEDDTLRRDLSAAARRRAAALTEQTVGVQLAALLRMERWDKEIASSTVPFGRVRNPEPLDLIFVEPSSTKAGQSFHRQTDGGSALVVHAANADRTTVLIFDDELLETVFVGPDLLTTLVPARLLRRAGLHELRLTDGVRRSNPLPFKVRPPLVGPPARLIRLDPEWTTPVAGFNVQPSGDSALSIVCERADEQTVVLFDDLPLQTTFGSEEFLSALLPPRAYERPGRYHVCLRDARGSSNEILFVVGVSPADPNETDG